MNDFERLDQSQKATFDQRDPQKRAAHCFDDDDDASRMALKAALAAERPLLVRGEPGVGKTQLAKAAAWLLERPLISYVVDAHTEARDLLWSLDSVRRLAEAQVCHAQGMEPKDARAALALHKFVEPGPLWWGFNWEGAGDQLKKAGLATDKELESAKGFVAGQTARLRLDCGPKANASNGRVILIDEIDKADADVPNGLLEALGSRGFTPRACDPVVATGPTPLVIITTNEERVLPDAFVRRCLVLHLDLPEDSETLQKLLVRRGRAHFSKKAEISDAVLKKAALLLAQDRQKATAPRPGQAEYIDLLRAYRRICLEQGAEAADGLMERLQKFTFQKHARNP